MGDNVGVTVGDRATVGRWVLVGGTVDVAAMVNVAVSGGYVAVGTVVDVGGTPVADGFSVVTLAITGITDGTSVALALVVAVALAVAVSVVVAGTSVGGTAVELAIMGVDVTVGGIEVGGTAVRLNSGVRSSAAALSSVMAIVGNDSKGGVACVCQSAINGKRRMSRNCISSSSPRKMTGASINKISAAPISARMPSLAKRDRLFGICCGLCSVIGEPVSRLGIGIETVYHILIQRR